MHLKASNWEWLIFNFSNYEIKLNSNILVSHLAFLLAISQKKLKQVNWIFIILI